MKIKFILPILVSFMFSASALAHNGNYCITVVNNTHSTLQLAAYDTAARVHMSNSDGSTLVGTMLLPTQQSVYTYLLTTSGSHSAMGFVLGSAGYPFPFPSTPFLVLDLDNGVTIDSTATSGGVYKYSVTSNTSSSCQGYQADDGGYNVIVSPLD